MTEFARTDFGQQTLNEVEEFGFPGVDSAADLSELQSMFLNIARIEREQMKKQRMPDR